MIGHDETGHDLALDDVVLHDFGYVGFGLDLIPHAFGIDHDTRPLGAMIEAPGFIGAYDVFQVQPLRFLLEVGVEGFRSKLGTTPTGIVGAPLVCTDENMTLKRWHGAITLGRHGDRIEPPHQKPDVIACKQRRLSLRGIQNGHDFPQPHGRAAKLVALGEF